MNFRRGMLILVALTLAGSSWAYKEWVVRKSSVGPVKIGMSLQALNKILHENFSMPENKDEQECF